MNQVADVIVWIGAMSPATFALNAPMTRKITKMIIHGQYNALTFVSFLYIRKEVFNLITFCFITF
jgi:hypothetical protein